MNILLLGKNGQLGGELQRSLAALGTVTALDRNAADLEQLESLRATVRAAGADIIVNAAAYTAVDLAENEAERASCVNALAPEVLAQEAERSGAWLIHYSTDYVFDGGGTRPRVETDLPAPLNVYGRTKLDGERRIAAACAKHLILRTSWVYAARGNNFAKTMLRRAQEGASLRVIDDQIGAPTSAALLADVTARAIGRILEEPSLAGVYHVAAAGETSWYGYARALVERAGLPVDITPVPSTAYATKARRPLNSRLNTAKFCAAFDVQLPDWRRGVDALVDELPGGPSR